MNILVINISLRPQSPVKLFPIGLGYVTTAIKNAGFAFDLLDIDAHRHTDHEVETLIRKKKYDVVCMGCIVTGYKIVKSLASVIKKCHPHATIVVGNSVASSIVDTLLTRTRVDIAVMGEGDDTIVDLLGALNGAKSINDVPGICFLKDGSVFTTAQRQLINDISSLPNIDFSIFDVDAYIATSRYGAHDPMPIPREDVRALPVNTARGCIASCGFCYHVFKGKPYRYRSPDSIVMEIKSLIETYDLNYIQFWDELTFFMKKQADEFVQKILDEDLHFYWVASCRADLFDSEEDLPLLEKMKAAGCLGLGYSLESADPEILKAMKKNITVEKFARQTRLLQKAGLATLTSLVLGYPQETPETIKKSFDCCIENNIYPSVGYLLPQPGSEMYDYVVSHGYITDEEEYFLRMGDRQDLRLNLTGMTDEEFESNVSQGLKRCNDVLKLGLKDGELIKTQHFRSKK